MKVVMLVNNACVNDARVIREAEALVEAGHEVVVLAVWAKGLPAKEIVNGVMLCRHLRNGDIPSERNSDKKPIRSVNPNARGQGAEPASLRKKTVRRVRDTLKKFAPILVKPARFLLYFARQLPQNLIRWIGSPTMVKLMRYDKTFRAAISHHQPDIVHAHNLNTLLAASGGAREAGARLVYDSHELETGRNGLTGRWHRWVQWRAEQYLIRRTDAVITVCDSIADYLSDLYKLDRPTVVLNSPHETSTTEPSKTLRNRLGLDQKVPLAVYVGSVSTNRGLENCIEALHHFPELQLALLGPRKKSFQESLVHQARRLKVEDRLHLVDPVPHHQVTAVLADATLSLVLIQNTCLSYSFCFPNKLLESLLGRLPVLVSRLIELERVVAETGAGIVVDETDPKAIAAGIRILVDNREDYVPDQKTVDFIRGKYGWDIQKQRLLALYDGLLPESFQGRHARQTEGPSIKTPSVGH